MDKPIIFTLIKHYLPGYKYGGPVRTVANLVGRLGGEFQFKILCLNRDFMETEPYRETYARRWLEVRGAQVMYVPDSDMKPRALRLLLCHEPFDVLYLNSVFDPRFSILPRVLMLSGMLPDRPVVLAPHGEFSSGALSLKATKKRLFLAAARLTGYFRRITWQASSTEEADRIITVAGAAKGSVHVAPNLPAAGKSDARTSAGKVPGQLRIVCVSRICQMKNLHFAIRLVSRIRATVRFDVYGPIDDASYWARCEKAIAANVSAAVQINYCGSIPHDRVASVLSQYDVFLLPTLGENYGHAIIEALAAGLPVVISDRTPWRGLAQQHAGFDIPLNEEGAFVAVLEAFAAMGEREFETYRMGAVDVAAAVTDSQPPIDQNKHVFRAALSR